MDLKSRNSDKTLTVKNTSEVKSHYEIYFGKVTCLQQFRLWALSTTLLTSFVFPISKLKNYSIWIGYSRFAFISSPSTPIAPHYSSFLSVMKTVWFTKMKLPLTSRIFLPSKLISRLDLAHDFFDQFDVQNASLKKS